MKGRGWAELARTREDGEMKAERDLRALLLRFVLALLQGEWAYCSQAITRPAVNFQHVFSGRGGFKQLEQAEAMENLLLKVQGNVAKEPHRSEVLQHSRAGCLMLHCVCVLQRPQPCLEVAPRSLKWRKMWFQIRRQAACSLKCGLAVLSTARRV